MSELMWCSENLRTRIAPPGTAQFVATRIRAAAHALGWDYHRTRDVWYADERVSIKPKELRDVEEASGVRYGRQELRTVEDLIADADALLMGGDPDFASPFVAAIRAVVGAYHSARASRRDGGAGE